MSHPPFVILDDDSNNPIYLRLYETIRRKILAGEYLPGSRLPATRYLAKHLGMSRMTVLNAYSQLTAEGYLESKSGSGTFIARQLPEEYLSVPKDNQENKKSKDSARNPQFSAYAKKILKLNPNPAQLNLATSPVPFQHGLAAIEEFPFDIWMKLMSTSLRQLKRQNFGYGESNGFSQLRKAIASHLKSARAVDCLPEQVIITSGAQEAFEMIGKVFLEVNTEVLIEDPGYFGVKHSFQTFGAKFIPVSVDEEGINIKNINNDCSEARLAYVTPSHQFPLGYVMSIKRRLELLNWAQTNNGWIIEDDYDSEFRYVGRPLPSLQGLDQNKRVLYVGTFSKTLFPALRLCCLVVPMDLIEIFTSVKLASGMRSPLADQAALAEFITQGHFSRHIRRMRKLYEKRQKVLVYELKERLGDKLEVINSHSGMHIIGWLPEGVEDESVVKKITEFGIKTTSVSSHYLTKQKRGGLIFGYTAIDENQIRKSVRQLSEILNDI